VKRFEVKFISVPIQAKDSGVENIEVESYVRDGLAVHPQIFLKRQYLKRGWTLSHALSGYAVAKYIKTRKEAFALLEKFLPICDWATLGKDGIMKNPEIKARAKEILQSCSR